MNDETRIELKLGRLLVIVEGIAKRQDAAAKKQQEQHEVIFGDGNGKRGIITRLSLVEQGNLRTSRFLWLFTTAAAMAVSAQVLA